MLEFQYDLACNRIPVAFELEIQVTVPTPNTTRYTRHGPNIILLAISRRDQLTSPLHLRNRYLFLRENFCCL
jgi:hypothetical protein